jgi:hypothetical protein
MHISIFSDILDSRFDSKQTYHLTRVSVTDSTTGLLRSLQDSGDPALDTSAEKLETTEAKVLSNGDKSSLFRYMGLPLNLFEKVSEMYDALSNASS